MAVAVIQIACGMVRVRMWRGWERAASAQELQQAELEAAEAAAAVKGAALGPLQLLDGQQDPGNGSAGLADGALSQGRQSSPRPASTGAEPACDASAAAVAAAASDVEGGAPATAVSRGGGASAALQHGMRRLKSRWQRRLPEAKLAPQHWILEAAICMLQALWPNTGDATHRGAVLDGHGSAAILSAGAVSCSCRPPPDDLRPPPAPTQLLAIPLS